MSRFLVVASTVVLTSMIVLGCRQVQGPVMFEDEDAGEAPSDCEGMGMTWRLNNHLEDYGADNIRCKVQGDECDPYDGDTSCSLYRRILCLNPMGYENPGISTDIYNGWTGAEVDVTSPIQGCELSSLSAANDICKDHFGIGWRMAEHHDGGGNGWGIWAFGSVPSSERFWVHIDDQSANCWSY